MVLLIGGSFIPMCHTFHFGMSGAAVGSVLPVQTRDTLRYLLKVWII